MTPTTPRSPHAAAALALLAFVPALTWADTPAPNQDMRFVSIGAQADNRHDQELLSTLSLPVGQRGWVQAGVGQSRSVEAAGPRKPAIVNGAVGLAGESVQATVSASHRADGGRYRQTDVGTSVDWRRGGSGIGLDVTHRRSQAAGTVAVPGAVGGSTTVPAQARVAGTGLGVHGTLQVTEHLGVYASAMRNHYKTSTRQDTTTQSGGLLGADPVLSRALLGGGSFVDRDELALDHSAQVGATWRWTKVALSGEYTAGQLHDGAGAMRSVDVKAAVDVAPGWRVAPGVGRGTTGQGGHATFASLAATYGW